MAIAWNAFSWEAFATIITGLSAVTAAVAVGFRQTAIQRQQNVIAETQTQIANRQATIQEAELRHAMFDRRYRAFAAVMNLTTHYRVRGNAPVEESILTDFYSSIPTVEFLFGAQAEEPAARLFAIVQELRSICIAKRANAANSQDERERALLDNLRTANTDLGLVMRRSLLLSEKL